MAKFLISNVAGTGNNFNVGIAPGKFDTKQLILSAIVVLERAARNEVVKFVRTIETTELSKCTLFINDDFTTDFPQIPSYHDIDNTWEKTCKIILRKSERYNKDELEIVVKSVKEKICDLEAIDCIMEFYEPTFIRSSYKDSFEEALKFTIRLIEKFISDSLNEIMYFNTVKANIQNSKNNYAQIPIYVQGWRNIVKMLNDAKHIQYAIFPEYNDGYIIEALDRDLIFKKHVKGMKGVYYSGRFFVKVTNMETALNVIERITKATTKNIEKLA